MARDELRTGFRLGDRLILPSQNRIVREDGEAHVEPRVMAVLVCLAERAGDVMSRDELHQAVWGRTVVTEQALTNCISELRRHLGDDRAHGRIIETIPKRGYRLAAPVQPPGGGPAGGEARGPAAGAQRPSEAEPSDLQQPTTTRRGPRSGARGWPLAGGLLLLAALGLALAWALSRDPEALPLSVAVVTFENAAGDEALDYLRLALPDEIATLLTRSPDLAVRPFTYLDAEDPLADPGVRRVGHVISGRYYMEDDDELALAVEAQQVAQERVVWRARITAPAGDLRTMRERIARRIQEGLLPALGVASGPSGPAPANDEAYRLYLRSLAVPKQPQPTERAIEMLERAVALDPDFALAWEALGLRYYDHGTYGPAGEVTRRQSLAAYRKALALDPELISVARYIISLQTEAGDLEAAHAEARRLVERFGARAESHFALAYVHRFGGLLATAQRHCELALDRDPHDPRLRSCAYAFLYAGKLSRVTEFLELDEGSYFVQWGTVLYHLRRDDAAAALDATRRTAPDPNRQLMEPCLEGARGTALEQPARAFVRYWQRRGDPETPYAVAPMLAYCGRATEALELVERAVDGNFCSYPALDLDPIWAGLRDHPEFRRIRGKAMACHDRYRRMVEAHDTAAAAQPS